MDDSTLQQTPTQPALSIPVYAEEVEVLVRPKPRVSRWGWTVAVVGVIGFMVCGALVFAGLAGAVFVSAIVSALIVSRTILFRVEPILWLCAAVAVSIGLAFRGSPWLIVLNMIAVGGLLIIGALTARGGSLFRLTRPAFVEGCLRSSTSWLSGFSLVASACSWVMSPERSRRRSNLATAEQPKARPWRSLFIAMPVLLVVVPLLRAGDAVFNRVIATLLSAPVRLVQGLSVDGSHLVNGSLGLWMGLTLLALAGAQGREKQIKLRSLAPPASLFVPASSTSTSPSALHADQELRRTRFGHEVVGATWILNAVLLVFAGGQVADVLGMTARLEKQTISYAEIAKEGFFPLLVACAVVLFALVCVHSVLRERRWESWSRRALQTTTVLTLLVIVVASRRLWIGADIWGLTMLRVLSQCAALLLIVVFGCLGAWQRRPTHRLSVLGVTVATATALLVGLNVMPVEAMIVRWNAHRPSPGSAAAFRKDADALDSRWGQGLGVARCADYYDKWHGRNVDGALALGPLLTKQVQLGRVDPLCARELLECERKYDTSGLRWNRARSKANKLKRGWCASLISD
jgi:hypothetical protein